MDSDSHPASCLSIMAVLAKGLPVFFVPEKSLVTAMRHDVVNDGGGCELAVSLAFRAQRVQLQVVRTSFAPRCAISTHICAST